MKTLELFNIENHNEILTSQELNMVKGGFGVNTMDEDVFEPDFD